MALEYDISGLFGKTENEGSTPDGRLTAKEFNQLIGAVSEVQTKVEGTIKGIKYNGGAEAGGQTFSSVDDKGYLLMTINNPDGTLSIELDKPEPYIARGSECPITVRVSSKDSSGASTAAACIVNFYLNSAQTPFYTGNVYDKEITTPGAAKELTIDLSKIVGLPLLTGELDNEIRVEVNNRYGITKSAYCYVKIVDLSLAVDIFDSNKVFTATGKPQLIARVGGTDAYVTALVDGKEILSKGFAYNGANTNFGSDIFDDCNTHGVHTLEVFASITRSTAEGELTITTSPITYKYIYGTDNVKPIVMATINNVTPEEYSNFEIDYIAYKYNPTASAVSDIVNIALCDVHYNEDIPVIDNEYIKVSQDATFNTITNSATGKATFSLFPVNGVSLIGKKQVVISIGDFIQVEEIEVKKSSVTLTQLAGHAVYLSANNRSNNEPIDTIRTWRSTGIDAEGKQLIVDTVFDDNIEFINTGSGWIADEDGNMAMHLRKGRFFTLNYAPFAENPTYYSSGVYGTGRGKTISIEFATRNCLNQNSKVIECLDSSNGQERGFVITASSATLKANTFGINANFKEDTRIKVDFVIEGKQIKYDFDTVSGENGEVFKGSSDEALAIIYVDGVYQCLQVIPTSTSFLQGNNSVSPSFIRFGSNDCDLDIYNIRVYDQALTPIQIVNNYAYDTPSFIDKINIAQRNNIFDDKLNNDGNKPNINIEKLRLARPELPFFYVKQPLKDGKDEILPQDKSNWLNVPFTEWKNPANETDKGEAAISWTATGGRWRNQGTSSMTYPWPWRNWDWQLKSGEFAFGDGTTGSKWSQYKGMSDAGSIKKITLKKDYASSEMCNNAITSEYFTDMALAIGSDYPNVLSPAQRIAGAAATPYRLTFVATPCFLFQKFNDGTKVGTAGAGYEALGMMNLIPNKNECDHLGFSDKSGFTWDNCRAQSWELADNMDDWFWYKKLEGIQRNDDGTYTNDLKKCYEARYPKDSTLNKDYWDILSDGKREESDFGMVVKDKETISADQRAALYEEQRDIIEFHNWLVDVNRQIPEDYKAEHGEYRKFDASEYEKYVAWEWNKLENGKYNEYDTPEYRLKKFIAEAPTRLIIDQFCLYYIWREVFHAFDSGFKNLQIYTMGKANSESPYMQWGCMVRDADTTLGIENTGKDIFPPHLEDIDYYTADKDEEKDSISNVKFVYGGAKNMYHAKSIGEIGGHPVLNGQLGSLWINLRDVYGSRIGEIYRALAKSSKSNWTSARAIKRFRDHQEKWCESLYNFGMRQYFGGSPFTQWITSGLGDKKNSRAAWLERGFYYRNSKYKNLTDCCTVRAICYETPDEIPSHNLDGVAAGYTVNVPFKFKSYIPMYIGLGASSQEMSACTNFMRITDVDNTYDVTPGPAGLNFATSETGDQNNWFFGTTQLTEIGDLARGCKIKVIQQLNLPKLRELNLGHEKTRDGVEYREYYTEVQADGSKVKKIRPFTNQYLESIECSTLKQLTVLDVTNHTVLKEIKALSSCNQLQKLYARGTNAITSVDLPQSTSLDTIYLGKNLVSLNLTDLTSIKEFEIEGANSIGILYIRNCGSYMAKRSYDIMTMSIASLERSFESSNGNICELTNINWDNSCNVDSSYLERLININATLSGYIYVKNMPNDLKVRLIAKYGNIDDPNNGLHIEYIQEEIVTAKMPSKLYLYKPGKYQLKFTVTPSYSNTYSSAEWKISANSFAGFANDNDAANGVITRYEGEADKQSFAKLTVTIKQLPYSNGDPREDIILESVVYFYERLAKPGDFVFNDGSYSDELDVEKTPIGICFYVDPNDKTRRLMCALNPINTGNNLSWGASKGFTYTTSAGTSYLGASEYLSVPGLSTGSLEENNLFNDGCYNVAALKDVSEYGLGITADIENIYVDAVYRDASNAKNDYFKTATEKGSIYTEIGWKTAETTIRVDGLQLQDGENTIIVNKNDRVPIGYYNTLALMQHRNKILDAYKDCDNQTDVFHRPIATEDYSELYVLNDYVNRSKEWSYAERSNAEVNGSGTRGELLYYHAASACFAYEPDGVNNLDNKFKKYNWFLPASGDLVRLLYYIYQSYDTITGTASEGPVNSEYNGTIGDPANAFKNAIQSKIPNTNNSIFGASIFVNNTFFSSTEANRDQAITINGRNGKSSLTYKYNMYKVVPICVF